MKRVFSRLAAGLLDGLRGIGRFVAKLWKHPKGRIGLFIAGLLVILAVFAPLIAPYDPYDVTQRAEKGLSPSLAHPLGTTITTGQDIFSMLIYGTRVSLVVGVTTGLATAFLGALMGVLTGYLGGIVDMVVMRVVDILLVIPTLPLTIVLTNLFGKSYFMIIFIFTIFGWTGLARVVRSQVLVLKNSNYVKAAELAGARRGHIMFRHILPGVSHLLIMSTALTSAGIGIFLSVFSFMRIGLAMEEIFNPRMKRSSGLYKLFKTLNNTYFDEVFASMDEPAAAKPEPVKEKETAGV